MDFWSIRNTPNPMSLIIREIPAILLSGNHKAIEEWRQNQSIDLTKKRRPDLILKKKDKI